MATNNYYNGLETFPNIDALRQRNISGLKRGAPVLCVGDQFAGDTGGGIFVWNPDSTADDNGQNIIQPNMVHNGEGGRWKAIDGFAAMSNPDKLFRCNIFFDHAPQRNEVIYGYSVATKFAFIKNFGGCQVNVQAPPAHDFTIYLLKNMTEIATLTFHSGGGHTFTFTTEDVNSDGEVVCNPGDSLWFKAEDSDTDLGWTSFTILGRYILDIHSVPTF